MTEKDKTTGRPLVRGTPVEPAPVPRTLGTAKGDFVVPDDFDAPLPDDVLAEFEHWETCHKKPIGPPVNADERR